MREAIFGANDRPIERHVVPEWPVGEVYLRGMSSHDRDSYEAELLRGVSRDQVAKGTASLNLDNVCAKVLVRCICDSSGARVFSDSDAAALGEKSGAVLNRLYPHANRLSNLGAAEYEEIRKNLESGLATDSGSSSPANSE